ncbi:MAG: selenocysteine-specific translation elongation factor [Candidatus Dormibacteria bacterium]
MIATAGHVDHGKSTLVRALTGMEPDRWDDERRRGLTIDLGYAWSTVPSGAEVAFVDVPGHERFTTNMLAGVGPVPAVLLVVAADGGWSAQTTEHVAALDALGVSHGLLAVTRSDLADPAPVVADVRRRLEATSLGAIEAVPVSAVTGAGLDQLRSAIGRLVETLPRADTGAPVRLWVDRSFSMRGFGTVLTGTLGAGRVAVDDVLELDGEPVVVRGLERLGRRTDGVSAVARVAVNLRSVPHTAVARGQAILTPGAWHRTACVDVRMTAGDPPRLARQLVLHIGSAAVPVGVRTLGHRHLRLNLRTPLPLRVGDRALLRDPGLRRVLSGVLVLDPAPPPLVARGAARARAVHLEQASGRPDIAEEVHRRRIVHRELLTRLGVPPTPPPPGVVEQSGWLVGASLWAEWQDAVVDAVERNDRRRDRLVEGGVTQAEIVQSLGLPDPRLLVSLVTTCPRLELADGEVRRRGQRRMPSDALMVALQPVLDRLARSPFDAPTAAELAAARLGPTELAAAVAAATVLRLPGDIVLAPDAPERAVDVLRAVSQPFTLSEARKALATSRRVAVPLLEHLDRTGSTRRVDDVHRITR